MKLTKTVTYDLTFTVEYFTPQEGGMDNDLFGQPVSTLAEAVHLLELAVEQETDKYTEWLIVCKVKRRVKDDSKVS